MHFCCPPPKSVCCALQIEDGFSCPSSCMLPFDVALFGRYFFTHEIGMPSGEHGGHSVPRFAVEKGDCCPRHGGSGSGVTVGSRYTSANVRPRCGGAQCDYASSVPAGDLAFVVCVLLLWCRVGVHPMWQRTRVCSCFPPTSSVIFKAFALYPRLTGSRSPFITGGQQPVFDRRTARGREGRTCCTGARERHTCRCDISV